MWLHQLTIGAMVRVVRIFGSLFPPDCLGANLAPEINTLSLNTGFEVLSRLTYSSEGQYCGLLFCSYARKLIVLVTSCSIFNDHHFACEVAPGAYY